MQWLFGVEVVAMMVVLRIVVPVLIMVLLVRALHRLETRWQVTPRPLGPVAGD
jgi:hypothetical protein